MKKWKTKEKNSRGKEQEKGLRRKEANVLIGKEDKREKDEKERRIDETRRKAPNVIRKTRASDEKTRENTESMKQEEQKPTRTLEREQAEKRRERT